MITRYKTYIEQLLKAAGVDKVCKGLKELKQYSGTRLAAILLDDEDFEQDGTKATVLVNGKKVKRIKKYSRLTSLIVVITLDTEEATDDAMCSFMGLLDKGIECNGNWVEIECKKGNWNEDADSILRGKVAVQLLIEFKGGIFVDKPTYQISDIDVKFADIEKS